MIVSVSVKSHTVQSLTGGAPLPKYLIPSTGTFERAKKQAINIKRKELQDAGEPAQLSRRLSAKTSLAAALAAEASSDAMHAG